MPYFTVFTPVTDGARRRASIVAAASCAVSCCLLPLCARPSLQDLNDRDALRLHAAFPAAQTIARSSPPEVRRDPFVAEEVRASVRAGVVRAVITGAVPRALLDDGTTTRVVGLGDSVDGLQIVTIDPQGLLLSDGERIELAKSVR
jgi:hypothetical protein